MRQDEVRGVALNLDTSRPVPFLRCFLEQAVNEDVLLILLYPTLLGVIGNAWGVTAKLAVSTCARCSPGFLTTAQYRTTWMAAACS